MLKQLRQKKLMKRILWALAIIIIPAFVFWGAGSALRTRGQGPSHAGTIFGKKVSFDKYGEAWQAVRNHAIMLYGDKLSEVYENLNLEARAWERLILLEEAKKQKVRVTDDEVIEAMQNFPFFQSNGTFDPKAYDLILKQVFKIEPRLFEEEIRGALVISKLRDFTVKDVTMTDEEVKGEYRKKNEKSKIAYILVSPNEFKKNIAVEDKELKDYYQNNTESFRVGEQVNIDYVGFEFENYKNDIEVTDEDIKSYYEKRKDEFDKEKAFEEVKDLAKNKLIQERAKQKALLAAEKIDYILADKTKTLEEVAKENSLTIKQAGLFGKEGLIPQIGWFPKIQRVAFKLNIGERSNLIKSKTGFVKGYYIIRLKEKKDSHIPPLEEVKEKIENKLKEEKAMELASEKAERLYKKIERLAKTKKLTFQAAASKVEQPSKDSEFFTRNDYVQGVGLASEFGDTVFNSPTGEILPPAKVRAGFCLFAVVEIQPMDEEKFQEEKKEFAEKSFEAKKNTIVNEWYAKVIESANLKSNIE